MIDRLLPARVIRDCWELFSIRLATPSKSLGAPNILVAATVIAIRGRLSGAAH